MKKIFLAIWLVMVISLILVGLAGKTEGKTPEKYWPVQEFIGSDSVLGKWYQDYVDTMGVRASTKDFFKRLAESDVLAQKLDGAGINYDDVADSIVRLFNQNWSTGEVANTNYNEIRASMLSIDIALGAVEASLSEPAKNEFRREVLRGANVIPEVVQKPVQPVEVMGVMLGNQELTDRINRPPDKSINIISPSTVTEPPRYDKFLHW